MQQSLKNKTVVVGMTGGMDSTVAAYLLKKQGYKVFGLGLVFAPKEGEEVIVRLDPDSKDKTRAPFQGVFHIEDIQKVKDICDNIEIPFFAADASKVYKHKVIDAMVAARIGGQCFSPEVYATEVIFEVLMEKAQKLGADFVATGHYAKVIIQQSSGQCGIHLSNDLKDDQSYCLTRLKDKVLKKLILPLSELRKQEVLKVRDMLGFSVVEKKVVSKEQEEAIAEKERLDMIKYIEERMPRSMIREGAIIDPKSESIYGDHEGIHKYYLGQKGLKTKVGGPLDRELVVSHIKYNGTIYLSRIEDMGFRTAFIRAITFIGEFDETRPIDVYVRFSAEDEFRAAVFYPKNNRFGVVEFKEDQKGAIFTGQFLAFYNRPSGNGKIIGGGVVTTGGFIENGALRVLPKSNSEMDEDEELQKANLYNFSF